jgi:hypothetical protein
MDPLSFLILFIIIAIIGGFIVHGFDKSREADQINAMKRNQEAVFALGDEARETVFSWYKQRRIPIIDLSLLPPLNLNEDEYPILSQVASIYGESISGEYQGVSLPIGYGAYYDTGKTKITSSLRIVDSGELILTTRRIIFIGHTHNISVDLNIILGIQFDPETITINRTDQPRADIFYFGAGTAFYMATSFLKKNSVSKEKDNTLSYQTKVVTRDGNTTHFNLS